MKRDDFTLPLTASPAALTEVVRLTNETTRGGVESRHAANSGSTRGSDQSHKAVMYGTTASGDNAYQTPLAGVAPCPLTNSLMARVTLPEPGARCAYHERVAQEQYARAKAYVERANRSLRERQDRIDRGEECPTCKGRDIERQELCGVFVCRQCPNTSWFDTRGAE
jgi:hypothetical protein